MISAYLDRFEEDKAVLLLGDEMKKVVFPSCFLPEGAEEGVYLKINIFLDEETTEQAETEAMELLRGQRD